MQRRKLDFGSGHRPRPGYMTCDIVGRPDFYFDPENYHIEDVPDGYFDEIICFNVLHHVKDLDRLAQEFERVLKIGGKLIIGEPKKDCYEANKALDYLWYRWIIPRHYIWWSQTYRDWRSIFKRYFRIVVDQELEASDAVIFRNTGV